MKAEYVGGEAIEQIQKAIRGKVLESYRNGHAGPRRAVAAVRR